MTVLDFLLASTNWNIPIEIYNKDKTQVNKFSTITEYMGSGERKRTQYKKVMKFQFTNNRLEIITKARKF